MYTNFPLQMQLKQEYSLKIYSDAKRRLRDTKHGSDQMIVVYDRTDIVNIACHNDNGI